MGAAVKICCIQSVEEAALAARYGARALGLVGAMPSGPGVLTEEKIAEITRTVPSAVETFLLTSESTAAGIVVQHARCSTTMIQLCRKLALEDYSVLRHALPGVRLVQVVHVTGPEAVTLVKELESHVDALLLDSFIEAGGVPQLGGTGRTHDWEVSRAICERAKKPVYLAGGLNAGNVAEAYARVRPFGVDVCSGVRTNDRLDEVKLAAFFAAIENSQLPSGAGLA